jgi:hypothetical protein
MHDVSSRSARQRLLREAKDREFSDDTNEVGMPYEEIAPKSQHAPVQANVKKTFVTDGPFAETKELIGAPRWR